MFQLNSLLYLQSTWKQPTFICFSWIFCCICTYLQMFQLIVCLFAICWLVAYLHMFQLNNLLYLQPTCKKAYIYASGNSLLYLQPTSICFSWIVCSICNLLAYISTEEYAVFATYLHMFQLIVIYICNMLASSLLAYVPAD